MEQGPSLSLDRVWQAGIAGHRIMVFLHLVSAPWWVRLVQRLGLAFWTAGLEPAYWWVELGLGLLVDRAVSRGGCGLRKSLGSLAADG